MSIVSDERVEELLAVEAESAALRETIKNLSSRCESLQAVAISELCPMCRAGMPIELTKGGWFHNERTRGEIESMGFSWPYGCQAAAIHDLLLAPKPSDTVSEGDGK